MKLVYLILSILIIGARANAQTGNTGIGTTTPGSKLTVNGSFAAAYTPVTATTYTAGENDFYIVWNGTAAGTVTLPASTSGPDRTGRLYFFKNTSPLYTLTLDAAGTELIGIAQTVLLQPGETGLLVKTNVNTASGVTYEVIQIGRVQSAYHLSVLGGLQNFADGTSTRSDFTGLEYSTNGGVDFNMTTDIWTCPQTGTYRIQAEGNGYPTVASAPSHAGFLIYKNSTAYLGGNYFLLYGGVNNNGISTAIANLVAGDQIIVTVSMCSGCATGMGSTRRRLEITRL